jgi:hypothetical protein
MPEAAPVPARLSPSARHVPYREAGLGLLGSSQHERVLASSQQQHERVLASSQQQHERVAAGSQQQPDRPPGLSRSSSQHQHPSQSQGQSTRGQHRRSPTAPEAHNHPNGASHHAHANGLQQNGTGGGVTKGKTWALGAEVVGDVDRDLGGLGPQGDEGVREKDAREVRAQAASTPALVQVQVNGAKNFTVRFFFGFLSARPL